MRLSHVAKLSTIAAVAAVAVVTLGGVETAHTQPTAPGGDVTLEDASVTATGPRTGTRLLRSWRDRVKVDGREVHRRVEVLYDYDAGAALRRVYDADGALVSEDELADPPQPSREEIAEAYASIRGDEQLGALSRMVGAHLDGGFLLREGEGEPCGPRTRCVQVFVESASRFGLHRHSVVDLRQRRIAYRSLRSVRGQ